MNWIKNVFNCITGISTPIGGLSWERKEIAKKIVDLQFPDKCGLKKEIGIDGYIFYWSKEERVASKELEGWEKVIYNDSDGTRCYLYTYDDLVFLKKAKQRNKPQGGI